MRRLVLPVFLLLSSVFPGCGKKGPPLAPFSRAPEAPKMVTARRLGDTVYLQMTVPDRSFAGNGPFSLDHIAVYAVTIAPGTLTPPNRDLLKPEHLVAKIPIQPPPDPDAAAPDPPDPRPFPGEVISFVEKITTAALTPQVITKPPPAPKASSKPAAARPAAPPATGAAAATPPEAIGPAVLTRLYVLQGVPKKGKGGAASARLQVPLLEAPGAPRPGQPTSDETSITVAWQPPPSTSDEAPGVLYNVYAVPAAGSAPAGATVERPKAPAPLNDKPIAEQTFTHAGLVAGQEQCFIVRSLAVIGTTMIESDPSSPICITPKDTFAPAAPKGLAAVASAGVVNLIWDANGETDLAGYLVLRAEAPGDTLQPLMRDPIRDTRYADRTARANVRYVYQIVAIDKAGNRSAPSNKVEEAAR